jgi:hypothetical protein
VEEAGDSAAPKKNGDKPLPSTGHHITANDDDINCNVLRWPDEFYEAKAVGSWPNQSVAVGAIVGGKL